jgi:hypothetical protein
MKTVWVFILLGSLIPAAFVVITTVVFRRWITRMGIPGLLPTRRPTRQLPREGEAPVADRPPQAT